MTGSSTNGKAKEGRFGAQTLALLATPLNIWVLRSLAVGPQRQAELRRDAGSPAQTTLRAHLRNLSELGAIERHRRNLFPGVLEFELTAAGRELAAVGDVLDRWLEQAPQGALELGSPAAKSAVKALVEGWSTTILRALAAGPLSLTSLDQIIGPLSYPSLERRMGAMRLANQIEARPRNGKGTPYAVTRWLRLGMAPLAAAARWERRHRSSQAPPLTRLDTEATFLLAVPLLRLPTDLSGSCRMAVEVPNGTGPSLAGVVIDVRNGAVTSCATRPRGNPDAWASGSTEAWLGAMIDADHDGLELGGDGHLAHSLLHGLHRTLFGLRQSEPAP